MACRGPWRARTSLDICECTCGHAGHAIDRPGVGAIFASPIIWSMAAYIENDPDPLSPESLARFAVDVASDKLAFDCLLYTSPSPRDGLLSRMPSSA